MPRLGIGVALVVQECRWVAVHALVTRGDGVGGVSGRASGRIPVTRTKLRSTEHHIDTPGTLDGRDVEEGLRQATLALLALADHQGEQVVQRDALTVGDVLGIGVVVRRVGDHDLQGTAPGARTGGRESQAGGVGRREQLDRGGRRDHVGLVVRVVLLVDQPDDERLAAAVEVEVADGVAQPAAAGQPTERALEVGKVGDRDRLVHGPAQRAADERGDRGGDPDDGPAAARDLGDVHAGVGRRDGHGRSSDAGRAGRPAAPGSPWDVNQPSHRRHPVQPWAHRTLGDGVPVDPQPRGLGSGHPATGARGVSSPGGNDRALSGRFGHRVPPRPPRRARTTVSAVSRAVTGANTRCSEGLDDARFPRVFRAMSPAMAHV